MAVSAKDVMALREKTGAGMMDCKKALQEGDGDFDAAMKYLREKGIASAAKRAGREANEGRVAVRVNDDHTAGAIIEVNSETDFVARNAEFIQVTEEYADWAIANGDRAGDNGTIPAGAFDETKLKELAGKIGENLQIARAAYLTVPGGCVDAYVHPGDQLGVLLAASGEGVRGDAGRELIHDLALQIAAAGPEYVTRDEVPAGVIEAEKEIYRTQMRNEGKPEQILDRIAEGKLNKYFEDVCLLDQMFVKESKKKVKDVIAETAKQAGAIEVASFVRFKVGDTSDES
ncbi:MAG: Elongation factor Ts [Calditrichaeota bacterium]|nr:Elongation factor Ts [Calditrichota bacterium]